MIRRLRRGLAVGLVSVALFAVGLASAGSVSAAIDPVAFQKVGCNVNDYGCYYARLYNGVPGYVPYCGNAGCSYATAGEPYYAAPYYAAPYYAAPYAVNPYYVSPYVVSPYVNGYYGGYGVYAPAFNGGIVPPLAANH